MQRINDGVNCKNMQNKTMKLQKALVLYCGSVLYCLRFTARFSRKVRAFMTNEVVVFIVYLVFMLGIGVFFFFRQKKGSEKTYFLGDRKMGAWVTLLTKAPDKDVEALFDKAMAYADPAENEETQI